MERLAANTGSSVDIMFTGCFRKIRSTARVEMVGSSLFVFTGEGVRVTGKVELYMVLAERTLTRTRIITFMLVDAPSQYNVMLGFKFVCCYHISSLSHGEVLSGGREKSGCGSGSGAWRPTVLKKMLCCCNPDFEKP